MTIFKKTLSLFLVLCLITGMSAMAFADSDSSSGSDSSSDPGSSGSNASAQEKDDYEPDYHIGFYGDENSIDVGASVNWVYKVTLDEISAFGVNRVVGKQYETGVASFDCSGLNMDVTAVEIPGDAFKRIADAANDPDNDTEGLKIIFSDGTSIEFDAVALAGISAKSNGKDLTVSIDEIKSSALSAAQKKAVGKHSAFDITVEAGNELISDIGGRISIRVPYKLTGSEKADGVSVYYVDENGNLSVCETDYNLSSEQVNWETDHLSVYMIGYDAGKTGSNPSTGADHGIGIFVVVLSLLTIAAAGIAVNHRRKSN